jgi:hypothetical protein
MNHVVFGQHESGSGGDKQGNVPLSSQAFQNMRKACKKVVKEFINLTDVGFMHLECAVQHCPVVLIQFEVETVKVWNAGIHTLHHLLLEVEKSGVVEWDSDMTGEGGGPVVSP